MFSVVSAVRDLGRLREITTVLVRYGFGEIVARAGLGRAKRLRSQSEPPPSGTSVPPEFAVEDQERGEQIKLTSTAAERIRLVLQDLGPSFIKLGQIASTRNDLLPDDVLAELKKLQDNVPPVPALEIRAVIEGSLGETIEKVFVRFDDTPLATASIGQVHRAWIATPEGEKPVVVKVQRPNVHETVLRDVELLHLMAQAIERAIPESRIYRPTAVVQQFDRSIMSELNFLVEAENAERFQKNFEGVESVRFPHIYKQASTKHLLTMEFFDGKKIDRAVGAGFDGSIIAKRSVAAVTKMIFEDGFFHADPHPGNILIMGTRDEPIIGVIDVGMVGRLSAELRDRTIDMMIAAVRNDALGVADALYAIGRPTKKIDMRAYRDEVSQLAEKYIGRSLGEIQLSAMLRDLVQGAMKYGLEIPPDFMMVAKSLMTIEGIGKMLDPDLDVFGETKPYFIELVKKRYSPERLGNELWRGVEQLSRASYDLPFQAREVLDDLRLGRLSINTVDPGIPGTLDRLGRRIFSGAVTASLILSGALIVHAGVHVRLGFGLMLAAGAYLALHKANDRLHMSQRKRRK